MGERYPPPETPTSILRNLAQMLQSILDTQPGDPLLLPRAWAVAWREDLAVISSTLRHQGS